MLRNQLPNTRKSIENRHLRIMSKTRIYKDVRVLLYCEQFLVVIIIYRQIMNHSKYLIGTTLVGMLLISPLSLYAKEIATGETGGTPPPNGAMPQHSPEPQLNGADAGGHVGIMPIHGELSSSSNKGGRFDAIHSGKMMASDTRPLTKKMERVVSERDGEHIMGSSTRDERKDGMREQRDQHRGEVFHHAGDVLIKRMNAAVARLTKLADRIDSRITKMKAGGTDTSAAEVIMVSARAKITEAGTAVTEAEAAIASVASTISSSSSTPTSDDKKSAKDALDKARQAILVAQKALTDILPHILGNKHDEQDHMNASSTHATNTPRILQLMKPKEHSTTTERTDSSL